MRTSLPDEEVGETPSFNVPLRALRDHIETPVSSNPVPALRPGTDALPPFSERHTIRTRASKSTRHDHRRCECILNNKAIDMSVTTTANTTTQSVLNLLADYELTHSEPPDIASPDPQTATLNPRDSSSETDNPDWWPTEYNGIPPHRPINYNLDRESRPWGSNGVETAFVSVMLNGVGFVAAVARTWRFTGGQNGLGLKNIKYSIGGER